MSTPVEVNLQLTSTTPMLMHAPTGVDPLHPMVKEARKVTSKKSKTDEDHEMVAWFDFRMGLYHDEEHGVHLPMANVWKSIQEAARMSKAGPKIEKAVSYGTPAVPLVYNGPSDPEELYKNPNFRSRMVVGVQRARVMRTRPKFSNWSAVVSFLVQPDLLDVAEFVGYASQAGELIGVGDYRKGGYGRFTVEAL